MHTDTDSSHKKKQTVTHITGELPRHSAVRRGGYQQNAREAQRNAERRNAEQHSTEQHSKRRAQQTVCDGSVRLQRNTA